MTHASTDAGPVTTKSRFPHVLVLLFAFIMAAAILTWILPAGRYQRVKDETTGRTVVMAGSYQRVESAPIGPWKMLLAVQQGMISASSTIFLIFLLGGALTVVELTGSLNVAIEALVRRFARSPVLIIPISCLAFALCGATFGMEEETIVFIPILVVLARRLKYDEMTAVAMCTGAATLGAGFGPINPFVFGIAQKLAELPLGALLSFRTVVTAVAVSLFIVHTVRYARRVRAKALAAAPAADAQESPADEVPSLGKPTARHWIVLTAMVGCFVMLVVGILTFDWGIDELAALFLGLGVVAGLIGGLGFDGTARGFAKGFGSVAFPALIVGFARAIFVVLDSGAVIDTMVMGMVAPLAGLPHWATVLGTFVVQSVIHLPIPSTSGQAVVTIPILTPLADLLNLPRQLIVLSYQYGVGIFELVYPTQGHIMAVLALAGIPYEKYVRFILPFIAQLLVLAVVILLALSVMGLN